MSKESIAFLNANTLIGDTDKRGNAWHYRMGANNHFAGAVPLDRAEALMDSADPIIIDEPCDCGCKLVTRVLKRKSNGHRYGTFTAGYQPHLFKEWLITNVSHILDDSLHIGSAGLLRGGAQAWVQVELSDNITTKEGVEFRPNLTSYTSFDGSLATAYRLMNQIVVCDNTMEAGIREGGPVYKRRHSSKSGGELMVANAREALSLIFTNSTDFAQEIAELCATTVTDKQWFQFLDLYKSNTVDDKGAPLKPRAVTIANNERDQLTSMYNNDMRVAPWRGTAFGVLQATNTRDHHYATVKNVDSRAERNMSNAVKGITGKADRDTMSKLSLILAA